MTTFDKEPAYVLHRRPYQELNSPVQFLTPGQRQATGGRAPVVEDAGQERAAFYSGAVELRWGIAAGNRFIIEFAERVTDYL